jgi:sugar lactone lactonase YvrE
MIAASRTKGDGMPVERVKPWLLAAGMAALLLPAIAQAAPDSIVIEADRPYPESLTSSQDGAVFFGGFATGDIYRAAPGAATATRWIEHDASDPRLVLGVFADDASKTLWVCSSRPREATTGATVVKAYDLTTAALKASYPFPKGEGLCNDIAVAADGTVYATDIGGGHVVRLAKGAAAFTPWSSGPALAGVDGIALLADGAVYVNTLFTGHLLRIGVKADGSAATPVQLTTSRPLDRPDGMRSVGGDRLLLAEQAGRVSEIRIAGDKAEVTTLADGYVETAAVTAVGDDIYVLEAKLSYMRDPAKAGQNPGPATAYRVKRTR